MNVRIIFHIDMNAFFASCEEIKRPYLKNEPFAVGSRYSSKGVLSTANYIARKYGVNSAMTVNDAKRKCPNLMILDSDYEFYEKCSADFIKLLKEYTDLVEQASIDEAFIDVTDLDIHPLKLAKTIQDRILNELKLPCSIGIGPTLFLAKMASDMKKPLGITVIRKREIKEKLYPLPIEDMFGIGKKTTPKLREIGINTIGDLANRIDDLKDMFGEKYLVDIKNRLEGKSNDVIDPNRWSEFSSIGNSRTSTRPLETSEDAYLFMDYVLTLVIDRLKEKNVVANTLTVQIKYTDFKTYSKGKKLKTPTNDFEELHFASRELFDALWNENPIRLIGVTASNLENIGEKKYDLFNIDSIVKDDKLNKTLDLINEKFGKNAIKKGF